MSWCFRPFIAEAFFSINFGLKNVPNFFYFQDREIETRSHKSLITHTYIHSQKSKERNTQIFVIPVKDIQIIFLNTGSSSYILRRPQNFVKSSPIIWLAVHRTNNWWRFLQNFVAFSEYINFKRCLLTETLLIIRIITLFKL